MFQLADFTPPPELAGRPCSHALRVAGAILPPSVGGGSPQCTCGCSRLAEQSRSADSGRKFKSNRICQCIKRTVLKSVFSILYALIAKLRKSSLSANPIEEPLLLPTIDRLPYIKLPLFNERRSFFPIAQHVRRRQMSLESLPVAPCFVEHQKIRIIRRTEQLISQTALFLSYQGNIAQHNLLQRFSLPRKSPDAGGNVTRSHTHISFPRELLVVPKVWDYAQKITYRTSVFPSAQTLCRR